MVFQKQVSSSSPPPPHAEKRYPDFRHALGIQYVCDAEGLQVTLARSGAIP